MYKYKIIFSEKKVSQTNSTGMECLSPEFYQTYKEEPIPILLKLLHKTELEEN